MEPYYSDDLATLYHGDCREILPDLGAFDLALTDPPYGINYVSNAGVGKGTKPITNDGARLSLRLYRAVISDARRRPCALVHPLGCVAGRLGGNGPVVPFARDARLGQGDARHGRPQSLGPLV